MKKIIIILFLFMVISVILNEEKQILIPDNAIRFRIIANSDTEIDQDIKMDIKNNIENKLYNLIGKAKNIEEARSLINNNLSLVEKELEKYNVDYDISFGNNYFPEKEFKGINYKAGNYESLVITLGEGQGKNWWCVLFPPLCLLDQETNLDDVEYSFYASKLINKFQ